jgi:hypothetical protein
MIKTLYRKQLTNTAPTFCWYAQGVELRQTHSTSWKLKDGLHLQDSHLIPVVRVVAFAAMMAACFVP